MNTGRPGNRFVSTLPPIARFFSHVRKLPNECWEWTANKNQCGYGRLFVSGKLIVAHRWYFEHLRGEIQDGQELDHLCRNRVCVNPAHLEVVDRRTNIIRGSGPEVARQRLLAHNPNAFKTKEFCCRGHALSGDNLIRTKRRAKRCKLCEQIRWRENRASRNLN